jgi:hypothetical protein
MGDKVRINYPFSEFYLGAIGTVTGRSGSDVWYVTVEGATGAKAFHADYLKTIPSYSKSQPVSERLSYGGLGI